jgi:8-oxo-dGTP diphosphatase
MSCRFTSATPERPTRGFGFAFAPRAWDGEPVNAEPHKHSELVWADLAGLPTDTAEYTAAVITAGRGLTFTLNGW